MITVKLTAIETNSGIGKAELYTPASIRTTLPGVKIDIINTKV
jgi:hypothetical protein